MLTALDTAQWFLALTDENEGEVLTNLKIQKLLYYAQGTHLALTDTPLFDEPIEAWRHGPVVRSVYEHYRHHGAEPIPREIPSCEFNAQETETLEEVYSLYGIYTALALRNMTHNEPPWRFTPQNEVISHQLLKDYFVFEIFVDA